jgi:hypothetical protein
MNSGSRYSLRSSTKRRRQDDEDSKRQRQNDNGDNERLCVKIFVTNVFHEGSRLEEEPRVYSVPSSWAKNVCVKKTSLTVVYDCYSNPDEGASLDHGNLYQYIRKTPLDYDEKYLISKLVTRHQVQEHISPDATRNMARIHFHDVAERPESLQERLAAGPCSKALRALANKYKKVARKEMEDLARDDPEGFLASCKKYDYDVFPDFFVPPDVILTSKCQSPDLCVYASIFEILCT